MRWTAIVVVVGALVRVAHADDASDAETLFNEGVKAKEAGKPGEACAKFRASYEKNRNAVGTILNVALCDEEAGKIGSAHKLFAEAEARATEQNLEEHRKAAQEHKDKLAGDVPRVTVIFTERVPEMKLVVGGDVVDPASAKDIEVDPGPVKIVASAPGRVPYEYTVTMHKGDVGTVTIPELGYPIEDKGRATLGKVVTFAGAGVVLAGIGVGIYANHKYNGEFDNKDCSMPSLDHPMCNQNGYAATHSAKTLGWVGTGVGVAGLVAVGVGVTLWITAPHHEQARQVTVIPSVAPDQAGIVAFGRF
jgi:hypothetical protein